MTIHAGPPAAPVEGQCTWRHHHEDVDLACDDVVVFGEVYCTDHLARLIASPLRSWTLEVGCIKPLTLNGARGNPRARAKQVKRLRHLAGWLARAEQIPLLAKVEIELHYVPRDRRRRDPMNLVPTRKALEDGIVDAGVIPDDTPEYSVPLVPVIDEPSGELGRLYVIVREVSAE